IRLSFPEAAKVGHSLTAFLKPWICWAWGSLGARPLVWISVSIFLEPSFSSIAWPSAPELLRGFRSALKCSPCSWFPCSCFPCSSWLSRLSRSPPLAKATETRLSDMATASSSASPSFFDKTFSFFVFVHVFCFPYHFYYFASPVQSFCSRFLSVCVPLGPKEQPPHLPEAFDTLRAESLVGVQEGLREQGSFRSLEASVIGITPHVCRHGVNFLEFIFHDVG